MNDGEAALDSADMERLKAGREDALDRLMERHAGRLCAYLRRWLQNESDAEDLAQEAFVRVFEHRDRFDARQAFVPWLYAIAGNLIRDRYRWRSRHPESPLEDGEGRSEISPGGLPVGTLEDRVSSPAEAAVTEERAGAVRRAIAALPPDLREPLLLAEYEDRSHIDIAHIIGCTPKAVEMRLYRARQMLRARLARWLES